MGRLLLRREAGEEDEGEDLPRREVLRVLLRDEAEARRALQEDRRVHPAPVVLHLDDDVVPLLEGVERDRPDRRLPTASRSSPATRSRDRSRLRIMCIIGSEELLDDELVDLRLGARHDQVHLLVVLARDLADDPRQLVEDLPEGDHPHLEDAVLHLRGGGGRTCGAGERSSIPSSRSSRAPANPLPIRRMAAPGGSRARSWAPIVMSESSFHRGCRPARSHGLHRAGRTLRDPPPPPPPAPPPPGGGIDGGPPDGALATTSWSSSSRARGDTSAAGGGASPPWRRPSAPRPYTARRGATSASRSDRASGSPGPSCSARWIVRLERPAHGPGCRNINDPLEPDRRDVPRAAAGGRW